MNANVVPIDYRAQARVRSDDAKRQKAAERSKRLVAAIQKNRRARLLATKQLWLGVTGVAAIVGMFAGVASTLAWQHGVDREKENSIQLPSPQLSNNNVVAPERATVNAAQDATNNIASKTINTPPTILAAPSATNIIAGKAVSTPSPVVVQSTTVTQQKEQAISTQTMKSESPKSEPPSTQYEAPLVVKPIVKSAPDATNNIASKAINTLATSEISYQIIGVPVDGVVQIKIGNNPTVKPVRVGEKFPNGEILKHANAETGQVETSARVLKAN